MTERQYDRYAMKDGQTSLGEQYFNPIWQDIDNRLIGVEDVGDRVDVATGELVRAGLRRIDEFLKPAYDNIANLAELGFLTATLQDNAPVTFAVGVQSFAIAEGPTRDQFRPAPYLTFQVGSDYHKIAVAITQSYNRATGALTVEFVSLSPELAASPGPHNAIFISAAAGSAIATSLAIQAAEIARQQAETAKAGAETARTGAQTARTGAETARSGAEAALATTKAATQSFLGAFAFGAFPTTRGDGSALKPGDQLYDTTNSITRVYDGTNGFVPQVSSSIGGVSISTGTFGSGTTGVINIAGGFTKALVWVNGSLLVEGDDYTAASPNITVTGAVSGDDYVVWSFKAVAATDYATIESMTMAVNAAKAELNAAIASARADLTAAIADSEEVSAEVVTNNRTLQSGKAYRILAPSLTLTLPANPTLGDTIVFIDSYGLSASQFVTLARNGKTIMGLSENMKIDVSGAQFILWFNGTDWRL